MQTVLQIFDLTRYSKLRPLYQFYLSLSFLAKIEFGSSQPTVLVCKAHACPHLLKLVEKQCVKWGVYNS